MPDPLEEYRSRRDFEEIGEPAGTDGGRLRHARFLGLRHDRDPGDVVRERPA